MNFSKVIHPNRWFIWALVAIFSVFTVLMGAIWLCIIELESTSLPEIPNVKVRIGDIDTYDWKTYRDESAGYVFKYDPMWQLNLNPPAMLVYKPEEQKCSHGVGCVYPGSINVFVSGKVIGPYNAPIPETFSELIISYVQFREQSPGKPKYSVRYLSLNGHNAAEITETQGDRYGSLFRKELLVEKDTQTIYRIQLDYFDQYAEEALTTYQKLISTLTFFEPQKQ